MTRPFFHVWPVAEMTTAVITAALNPWAYGLQTVFWIYICTFVILVSNITYNRAVVSHNKNLPHFDGFRNPFVKEVFMNISVLQHNLWIPSAECFWAHTQHVLITRRKNDFAHTFDLLSGCDAVPIGCFSIAVPFFVLLNHSHNEYKWFCHMLLCLCICYVSHIWSSLNGKNNNKQTD